MWPAVSTLMPTWSMKLVRKSARPGVTNPSWSCEAGLLANSYSCVCVAPEQTLQTGEQVSFKMMMMMIKLVKLCTTYAPVILPFNQCPLDGSKRLKKKTHHIHYIDQLKVRRCIFLKGMYYT